MSNQEVGRWQCAKCGKTIVATGPRSQRFKASAAFSGPCPWDCGAYINRGFRSVQPGEVRLCTADEWDQRAIAG